MSNKDKYFLDFPSSSLKNIFYSGVTEITRGSLPECYVGLLVIECLPDAIPEDGQKESEGVSKN